MTRRQSHLLTMSGMTPTPDLRAAMSEFGLIPSGITSGSDVTDTHRERGVLTHKRHSRLFRIWRSPRLVVVARGKFVVGLSGVSIDHRPAVQRMAHRSDLVPQRIEFLATFGVDYIDETILVAVALFADQPA
jgi:hypothetical protein